MEKDMCQACMGTGEGLYPADSFGPDSESSYLAACNSCRGSGFRRETAPVRTKPSSPNALKMAVAEIQRRFAIKELSV